MVALTIGDKLINYGASVQESCSDLETLPSVMSVGKESCTISLNEDIRLQDSTRLTMEFLLHPHP